MKKYIENINCIREGDHFAISWDNSDRGVVQIYYNTRPDIDGNEIMLGSTNSGNIRLEDPLKERRIYFILKKTGYDDGITAEKILPLEGICNFRDMGGYETTDGRRIRWNQFYRSAALGQATANDLAYLKALGLKEILDFRSGAEAAKDVDPQFAGCRNINISALPMVDKVEESFTTESLFEQASQLRPGESPASLMSHGYREMVFNNNAFKKMVKLMQGEVTTPFLIHCQSGKDRTGIGSALLLLILGVPLSVVKEDYLLSRVYMRSCRDRLANKYKDWLNTSSKLELFNLLMTVREEYIDNAFHEISTRYPNLETYFDKEYGLKEKDIKQLRDRYLD